MQQHSMAPRSEPRIRRRQGRPRRSRPSSSASGHPIKPSRCSLGHLLLVSAAGWARRQGRRVPSHETPARYGAGGAAPSRATGSDLRGACSGGCLQPNPCTSCRRPRRGPLLWRHPLSAQRGAGWWAKALYRNAHFPTLQSADATQAHQQRHPADAPGMLVANGRAARNALLP